MDDESTEHIPDKSEKSAETGHAVSEFAESIITPCEYCDSENSTNISTPTKDTLEKSENETEEIHTNESENGKSITDSSTQEKGETISTAEMDSSNYETTPVQNKDEVVTVTLHDNEQTISSVEIPENEESGMSSESLQSETNENTTFTEESTILKETVESSELSVSGESISDQYVEQKNNTDKDSSSLLNETSENEEITISEETNSTQNTTLISEETLSGETNEVISSSIVTELPESEKSTLLSEKHENVDNEDQLTETTMEIETSTKLGSSGEATKSIESTASIEVTTPEGSQEYNEIESTLSSEVPSPQDDNPEFHKSTPSNNVTEESVSQGELYISGEALSSPGEATESIESNETMEITTSEETSEEHDEIEATSSSEVSFGHYSDNETEAINTTESENETPSEVSSAQSDGQETVLLEGGTDKSTPLNELNRTDETNKIGVSEEVTENAASLDETYENSDNINISSAEHIKETSEEEDELTTLLEKTIEPVISTEETAYQNNTEEENKIDSTVLQDESKTYVHEAKSNHETANYGITSLEVNTESISSDEEHENLESNSTISSTYEETYDNEISTNKGNSQEYNRITPQNFEIPSTAETENVPLENQSSSMEEHEFEKEAGPEEVTRTSLILEYTHKRNELTKLPENIDISSTIEIEKAHLGFDTTACEYCSEENSVKSTQIHSTETTIIVEQYSIIESTPIKIQDNNETSELQQTENLPKSLKDTEVLSFITSSNDIITNKTHSEQQTKSTAHSSVTLSTTEIEKDLIEFESTPCEYCNSAKSVSSSFIGSTQHFPTISTSRKVTEKNNELLETESAFETNSGKQTLKLQEYQSSTMEESESETGEQVEGSTTSEMASKATKSAKESEGNKSVKLEQQSEKHIMYTTLEDNEVETEEHVEGSTTSEMASKATKSTKESEGNKSVKLEQQSEKHIMYTTLEDNEVEDKSKNEESKKMNLFNYTHGNIVTLSTDQYSHIQSVSPKPIVIIVNNYKNKHQKLNRSLLEGIISTPITDVELHYIDLNSGDGENMPLISVNKSLDIDMPYQTCKEADFENGHNCLCNIQSYLNSLISKISKGEIIKSKKNYCDSFLRLKAGLLIKHSVKPVKRKRRGLIYMDNLKHIGETLQYESIDGLFDNNFILSSSDSSLFCLPTETVKIPCYNNSDKLSQEQKEIVWMFYSLSSSKGEILSEKGEELVLHEASVKNIGNYTCSPENEKVPPDKQRWHELEMITFPIYEINMNIFYKINESCSLQTGDTLYAYLPKIVSRILCSDEDQLCSVEIERPRCSTREDYNYFNVTMKAKMSSSFVLPLHERCDINCKLSVYENVVNIVYKNSEIIEHIPVYSQLEPEIAFIPHLSEKERSPVYIKPPRIIVSCPAGYGLESKQQSVCVPVDLSCVKEPVETYVPQMSVLNKPVLQCPPPKLSKSEKKKFREQERIRIQKLQFNQTKTTAVDHIRTFKENEQVSKC